MFLLRARASLTLAQVMAPAIMGNVVVWKPSDTAILGSYRMYVFI